ncbi:MAG TPA: DUF6798 domain-containing protein [Candidatus Didemnitutus sp.]|nr:DUF6798 domain-containing protein [Candidatus Didemnitutus sp.]
MAIITAAVWLVRGYVWPVLSNVEVDALRAMVDPTLFHRDFAVQENLHFSPRFYYYQLVLLPVRAGVPLEWSFALGHVVAVGAMLGGLRALTRAAGLGEVSSAVFTIWLLVVGVGTLGGVYFYTQAPVPAVWAGALLPWGAWLAWRGRWTGAFTCFGAAVLLQFLVGFYAGVVALAALLWMRRGRGLAALIPWLLALALVYGPMALTGGTGSDALNNSAFVYVYAQLRVPHHVVPSTWGWASWVQFAAFYIGLACLLLRTRAGRSSAELTVFFGAGALMLLALAANFIFVEIVPVGLVAKLQPARITPLVQGVGLLLLATRVDARLRQRDWPGGVALALVPFTVLPGLLLALAAVLLPRKPDAPIRIWPGWVLMLAVALAFLPFDPSFGPRLLRYTSWALLVGVQLAAFALLRWPRLAQGAALLSAVGAASCAVLSVTPRWPARLAAHFSIDVPPQTPPAVVGWRFGQHSHPDALVLVPPTSEAWAFKLYARRAAVVDDKSAPFTDRGLREWQIRMESVAGQRLTPGTDVAAAWRARTPESIAASAARYGAHYVLTSDDSHPVLPGTAIEREAGWTLWQMPVADGSSAKP